MILSKLGITFKPCYNIMLYIFYGLNNVNLFTDENAASDGSDSSQPEIIDTPNLEVPNPLLM